MSYRDQSWESRFNTMGDIAESQFEERSRTNYVRTGLSRPPISLVSVPDKVRYMPDYLTHRCWVEVMGYGRDQILKCKTRKWSALADYDTEWEVGLFLWDSHNKQDHCLTYTQLNDLLGACATLGTFPEGHEYWGWDMNLVWKEIIN